MSENLSIPIVLYSNENITGVVEHITIDRHLQLLYRVVPYSVTESLISFQGGHDTGKTGNLVLTFSRQGKHREFCFGTGKNFETQGKYFSVTQGKF